jgi:hypothetical protein
VAKANRGFLHCLGYPVRASGPNGEKPIELQWPVCPRKAIIETGGGSETKPLSQKLINCGSAHWICSRSKLVPKVIVRSAETEKVE